MRRDATPEEIKRAYRRLARQLHPDVNPDPETQERFKEITAGVRGAVRPEKRQMYDLGGDPLSASGGGLGFGAGFGGFGDIMDAFFGGGASRGPRPACAAGQDALIRVEIDLAEAAFGADARAHRSTPRSSARPARRGHRAGHASRHLRGLPGPRRGQQVQRSFLGQVMTSRPCPQCGGFGTVIRHPCPECSGDGRVRTRRTVDGRRSRPASTRHAASS